MRKLVLMTIATIATVGSLLVASQSSAACGRKCQSRKNKSEMQAYCDRYVRDHPGLECRVDKRVCPKGFYAAEKSRGRGTNYSACVEGKKLARVPTAVGGGTMKPTSFEGDAGLVLKRASTSLTLARLSQQAYSDNPRGASGFQRLRFIDTKADTQALLAQRGNELVLAIRGSLGRKDWLRTNANVLRVPQHNYVVHAGFFRAAKKLEEAVGSDLRAARSAGRKVWLAGHSLGGAVAQLLATSLSEAGFVVDGVMTFGSPSPGDANWAERYNRTLGKRTQRWIHLADVVACMPPSREVWRHAGQRHYLSRSGISFGMSGQYCANPPSPHDPAGLCRNQSKGAKVLRVLTGVEAHCQVGRLVPDAADAALDVAAAGLSGKNFDDHDLDEGYIPALERNVDQARRETGQQPEARLRW